MVGWGFSTSQVELVVKNPRLLDTVAGAIYQHRGEALPEQRPADRWAEDGYAITAEQLKLRCQGGK